MENLEKSDSFRGFDLGSLIAPVHWDHDEEHILLAYIPMASRWACAEFPMVLGPSSVLPTTYSKSYDISSLKIILHL